MYHFKNSPVREAAFHDLLSDVLPHLPSLSFVFQRESVDLCIVEPQVAATIAALKQLHKDADPRLGQLEDQLTKLETNFGLIVTESMKHVKKNIREKNRWICRLRVAKYSSNLA